MLTSEPSIEGDHYVSLTAGMHGIQIHEERKRKMRKVKSRFHRMYAFAGLDTRPAYWDTLKWVE